MRQIPILLLLLLGGLAACRQERAETARAQPGSPADSELTWVGDTVEAAQAGMEYEAPRLIPAMRAQLEVMRGGGGATEGKVTRYKAMAGDLVTAMLTDLHRVGSSEADGIRMLGDSVVNNTALMARLIDRYQEAMRAARP